MSSFASARLKLTAWYLLIIMAISSAFSLVIYTILTSELDRLSAVQRIRIERQFRTPYYIDPDLVSDVKDRLIVILFGVNCVILITSGLLGYLLAGQTLHPIEVALEDQNRFIADASHELRTPLTALKTEVEVALRDPHLNLIEAKKYLSSSLEEIDKLKNLTNNLLSLSRAKSHDKLPFTSVDLQSLVTDLCKLSPRLENQVSPLTLQTHPETIRELLSIFIDNALKYSPASKKVYIESSQHSKSVEIKVRDQGPGIKSADINLIFNRFYRADSSRTKTSTNGFGLGLAIAKNLADSIGGKIHVRSQQNYGSTFSVILSKKSPSS